MQTIDKAQLFSSTPQIQNLLETLDHIITVVNESAQRRMTDKEDKVEEGKFEQQYNLDIEESLQRDVSCSINKDGELPIFKDYASNAIEASHSMRTL